MNGKLTRITEMTLILKRCDVVGYEANITSSQETLSFIII